MIRAFVHFKLCNTFKQSTQQFHFSDKHFQLDTFIFLTKVCNMKCSEGLGTSFIMYMRSVGWVQARGFLIRPRLLSRTWFSFYVCLLNKFKVRRDVLSLNVWPVCKNMKLLFSWKHKEYVLVFFSQLEINGESWMLYEEMKKRWFTLFNTQILFWPLNKNVSLIVTEQHVMLPPLVLTIKPLLTHLWETLLSWPPQKNFKIHTDIEKHFNEKY